MLRKASILAVAGLMCSAATFAMAAMFMAAGAVENHALCATAWAYFWIAAGSASSGIVLMVAQEIGQ